MKYLSTPYQWRHLTRPQVAAFGCPVTAIERDIALKLANLDKEIRENIYKMRDDEIEKIISLKR
jgi:hypothetical protein